MNYAELFYFMHPDFFKKERIRTLPKDKVFTELVMDLRETVPEMMPSRPQDEITFGEYHGRLAPLLEAVARVDEGWVQEYTEEERYYCAFDGEKIAAFCCLSDMAQFQGLHIGGPGCVGTLPEYRRRGIGLEMVRLATETLRQDGFDISWIHYTHLENWYKKLGYRPVLRWNSGGMIAE